MSIADKIIKEADVLDCQLKEGVVNIPVIRSFLSKVKSSTVAQDRKEIVKKRNKHLITLLKTTKYEKKF